MAELNLDTLDVDAVNTTSASACRAMTSRPANVRSTSRSAQLYLGGRRDRGVSFSDPRFPQNASITVQTTDTLDREDMIRLMAASIIQNGVRYAFYALEADSTEDNGITAKDWLEITFKPAG